MKIIKNSLIYISLVGMVLCSFNTSENLNKKVTSSIEWLNTEYDFGKIKKNNPVSVEFEFKNPSMIPLVILSVEPSCGCTVAEFPKEPMKSGQKGKIKVTYDAKDLGHFKKSITVNSNASQSPSILYISGEVSQDIKD